MSTNRDIARDRQRTVEVILGGSRIDENDPKKNWLGHKFGEGQAKIDELMLGGATWDQMLEARGAVERVMTHYPDFHGLKVIEKGGLYSFDKNDLGVPSVGHESTPEFPIGFGEVKKFLEGGASQSLENAYERNQEAREECIRHYGTKCSVCAKSLSDIYGPIADGFVHVHHVRLISTMGGEYVVNPVEDLRPVCPNCHAIIHLGGKCRSIAEVKRLYRDKL